MNIAELFIRRPIMTTLAMMAILLFGIIAYRELPVSDLPTVDYPTIEVSASLPGASPETMAAAVATPLEREFSTISGLESMSSQSSQSFTQVTLQFSLSRNIDAAAQDVQAAIARTQGRLPTDMPSPPNYQKSNPADQPILFMAVYSDTLSPSTVNEYADTMMAQRISTISGVAQVQLYGAQKFAVRVQLDPRSLATRGVGIDDVMNAIHNGNVNLPTGTLYGEHKAFVVQANGQLRNAAAYRPLIVAYRNGAPVRLEQLGQVFDSVENNKVVTWFNQRNAQVLAIERQPGTNTIEVVNNIQRLLPTFRKEIPQSIHLVTLYDASISIRDSVNDVKFTLYLTLCLVVLVIFLFLRNVSATIIPSLALPMSIVGTFSVMYLLHYTLDNLSLMALVLAVGFVVDDAIVMLENIVRHLEAGEGVMEAALNGSKEISFTILSMTLSLAAVFIPVLFMSGILGRLLHEFSVTIMSAVLVSGLVSLTLTPMLCSRFLRHAKSEEHGFLFNLFERFHSLMLAVYDWSLTRVLRHRFITLLASFAIIGVSLWLFVSMPKGFLPSEDGGFIMGLTLAQQGISFDSMKAHQRAITDLVQADPNVQNCMSFAGAGGGLGGGNSGFFFMHLKPRPSGGTQMVEWFKDRLRIPYPHDPKLRYLDTDQVLQGLRPRLMAVPGIMAFMQNPPPIQIGGHFTTSQYQFTVQGSDTTELYRESLKLADQLRTVTGVQDLNTDLQVTNPQVNVVIDRDKANALGVNAYQVENALEAAYSSRQVSTIYAPNNEYWVMLELEPQYQMDPQALSLLYIRSSSGQEVPLSAVSKLTQSLGPLQVNHTGQLPSVTVSFNLKPGTPLGDVVNRVEEIARQSLPSDLTANFEGAAQQFESSLTGLAVLLIVTILVIYIVLGILYESFIHPLTILSGLPSAALGALLTLKYFGYELDLYAFVGIIMLIGIVKKNAIMMIDFALDAERNAGKTTQEAIYYGALVRFRPIMMTTMAALMGTMPIAVGFGAGAEARRPLGLCVVGGLVFSQLITLYITPVYYTYLDSFQKWLQRLFTSKQSAAAQSAPALNGETVGRRP